MSKIDTDINNYTTDDLLEILNLSEASDNEPSEYQIKEATDSIIARMRQQLNFDLSKTTPIEPPSGGKIWLSGVVLRKVSKFVTGASEDGIVPIPIFFDPETKEILEDTIPKEIREDYK